MNSARLPPGLVFRLLDPSDSLEEITSLLNRAYAPLAAAGFRYVASHQNVETTRERAASGECRVGVIDGRIVATATLVFPIGPGETGLYAHTGVAKLQQFAVEPDLQGCGVGSALMELIESRARTIGATQIALDTAEGAVDLRSFYARRGYRFVEFADYRPVTNYRSVRLSLALMNAARD